MAKRGEIVLVHFPFSSGTGGKVRPALIVQSDANNRRLVNTIVAMITSTTGRAVHEPTQYLIEISTPEGKQPGLLHDLAVKCENLFTIEQVLIARTIGSLPTAGMEKVARCL